jgi:hypothetical protein
MISSCQNPPTDRNVIENEINNAVVESLTLADESLFDAIMSLYQRDVLLKKFSNGNNDYTKLMSMIVDAQLQGDFNMIDSSLLEEAQNLRVKLDSIHFYDSKHLNFKYLHEIINPILLKYEDDFKTNAADHGPTSLIQLIGTTDLDEVDFNFTLYLSGLVEQMNNEMFESELNSNLVLLTTYGNFIYYSTN